MVVVAVVFGEELTFEKKVGSTIASAACPDHAYTPHAARPRYAHNTRALH